MLQTSGKRELFGIPVIHWLVLVLCCLAGYWPLSSMLFSLKNDAYVYFLPNRFLISDALWNGRLPWWTPYLQMGHPLHGDMQSGAWNPVVWFISLFGRYDMNSLHAETLLYFFLGGVGMYKLSAITGACPLARLLSGISYMFCGFMIDTAQITVWTASAAFIPFVFLYLYRILYIPGNRFLSGLKGGLFLYMLLVSGYPSFLIMCLYLAVAAILFRTIALLKNKQSGINEILSFGGALLVMGTVFCILSLPAILSYLDYLPSYRRGSGTSLAEAQENPFSPFGLISGFAPFSVTREHDWLATNPTSRSLYTGLFSLFFLAGTGFRNWSARTLFIGIATVLIFIFTLGELTPLRGWMYHTLPGMNLFRHPGSMRVFVIIGILLLATPLADGFLMATTDEKKHYRIRAWGFAGICLAMIFLSIPGSQWSAWLKDHDLFDRNSLRSLYEEISFSKALLIDSVFQLACVLSFILMLSRHKPTDQRLFLLLFAGNLVIPAQLTIPATVVSRVSPAAINRFIAQSPAGYPLPAGSIHDNIIKEQAYREIYGPASAYLKQIAWIEHNVNPSISTRMRRIDDMPALRDKIFRNPAAYLADTLVRYRDSLAVISPERKILFSGEHKFIRRSPGDSVWFTELYPGYMNMTAQTVSGGPVAVMQQYNKNWKLMVDGKEVPVKQGNIAFMYAWVPPGKHVLVWTYQPYYLNYAFFSSATLLVLLAIWLLIASLRRSDRTALHR